MLFPLFSHFCFLVTTRSWAAQLRLQLREVVKVADIALTWFAPNDPSRYAPDVFPAFLRDQDGVHMFGVPTLDSYSVKVVSHTAADTQYESVDDVPATVSRAAIEEISRNATTFFADLSPEPDLLAFIAHEPGRSHGQRNPPASVRRRWTGIDQA